jgi:hypothetical protein
MQKIQKKSTLWELTLLNTVRSLKKLIQNNENNEVLILLHFWHLRNHYLAICMHFLKSFETSTTFEVRKSLIDNLEEVKNNLHLETFKFTISLLQNWKKDFQSKCTCFLKQAGKKFRVTWFLLVYKLRRKKSTFWTNIPSKMVPIYCCHLGQCNYYYNF